MDLMCRHCGEVFDIDEFDDAFTGTRKQWITAFRQNGCGAVKSCFEGVGPGASEPCLDSPVIDDETLDKIGILDAMLGDDIDGLAAMTERL